MSGWATLKPFVPHRNHDPKRMTVKSFVVSPFSENCYVVHDGGEAALIDPGTESPEERQAVLEYIETNGLRVRHLLLTHAHIDHIFGCAYFADKFRSGADHVGWQLHEADLQLISNAPLQAEMFGIRIVPPPEPTYFLSESDVIEVGAGSFSVLHAPGHSPGSVCFYNKTEGFVIGGDVLFQGSIGRTDLWEGSYPTLINSIKTKLLTLPDATVVHSGHGPATTIGQERQTNPFLT